MIQPTSPWPAWMGWLASYPHPFPRVVEVGTRRSNPAIGTSRKAVIQQARKDAIVLGLDVEPGEDVDIVADLHDVRWTGQRFDAALAVAVWEHLRRPWVAARELATMLRCGGRVLVHTHQSFPLHAYPSDYFRFSTDALRELFAEDAGWRYIDTGYEFPAKVVPLCNEVQNNWNFVADAWLCSWIIAERI